MTALVQYNIYIQKVIDECINRSTRKEVLNVGSGECALDYWMVNEGFDVISTDYKKSEFFEKRLDNYREHINWQQTDILDLNTFSVKNREIVICLEVLEHLVEYKKAFENLLTLTEKTLIIGVPWKHSFNHPAPPPEGHCNFWEMGTSNEVYKDIYEFEEMCKPHKFSVEKILTKPEDASIGQAVLLMIIEK